MATPAWAPTVADVARHLRARTRSPSGADLGTFTDVTTPTDEQVQGMIDDALPFVSGKIGTVPLDSPCEEGARTLASLKAAEMVEISYFPEQLAPGGTVAALRALFADLLPGVQACVSGGGEGGGDDADNTPPSSCFYDVVDYDGGGLVTDGRFPGTEHHALPPWRTRIIDTSEL